MDQQYKEEECLDMALTIEDDGLSLNPFDRPPNMLMDDDLNRVTQEELEANLSTDCPTTSTGVDLLSRPTNTNYIWEEIIHSVIEDSTAEESNLAHEQNGANVGIVEDKNINNIHSQPYNEIHNSTAIRSNIESGEEGVEHVGYVVECYGNEHDYEHIIQTTTNEKEENKDINYSVKSVVNLHQQAKNHRHHQSTNCNTNKDEQLNSILGARKSYCKEETAAINLGQLTWNGRVEKSTMVESNGVYHELNDESTIVVTSSVGDKIGVHEEEMMEAPSKTTNKDALAHVMDDHCYGYSETTVLTTLRLNLLNHLQNRAKGTKSHEQLQTIVSKLVDDMDEYCITIVFNALKVIRENRMNDLRKVDVNRYKMEDDISREDYLDAEQMQLDELDQREPMNGKERKRATSSSESSEASSRRSRSSATPSSSSAASQSHSSAVQPSPTPSPPPMSPPTPGSPRHRDRTTRHDKTIDDDGVEDDEVEIEHKDGNSALCSSDGESEFERSQSKPVQLLAKIKQFASKLLEICNAFDITDQSDILQRLKALVGGQWNDWHAILLFCRGTIMVDADMQTMSTFSSPSPTSMDRQVSRNKKHRRRRKRATLSQMKQETEFIVKNEKEEVDEDDKRWSVENNSLPQMRSLSVSSFSSSSSSSSSSSTSSSDQSLHHSYSKSGPSTANENSILNEIRLTGSVKTEPSNKLRSPSIKREENALLLTHSLNQRKRLNSAMSSTNQGKQGIKIRKLMKSDVIRINASNSSTIASLSDTSLSSSSTSSLASSQSSSNDELEDKRPELVKRRTSSFGECDEVQEYADGIEDIKIGEDMAPLSGESEKEYKHQPGEEAHDEIDPTDREIERLINLDGLEKRSLYSSSNNKPNSDRAKMKVSSAGKSSPLEDSFSFLGNAESGSDDSKNDSDKEANTESQYLLRLNEEIKNNLLYDSSTNSEELESGLDYEPTKFSSSDEEDVEADDSNSENSSPLVTKFLETIRIENGADGDEKEKLNDESNTNDTQEDENANKQIDMEDNKDAGDKAKETKGIEKINGDELNSSKMGGLEDDVLSKDISISKKNDDERSLASTEAPVSPNEFKSLPNNSSESKLKELEKHEMMICSILETEKRKRSQQQPIDDDLISLSSESSSRSSAKEVDEDETKESIKVRAIKPMLRPDQLASETIKAQKMENERIARLEKKNAVLNKFLKETNPDGNKQHEVILDYIKETKTFVRVHTDIVKLLKHHQCDGIRFMYDACYGGVDSLKKNAGSGCILAHCMGLGKTLQIVALFHTLTSYKELKTTKILVLCPKSTVMNWNEEIFNWLEPVPNNNMKVFTFTDTSDINDKLNIIRKWSKCNNRRPGCLLIGYEAFRALVFYHSYRKRCAVDLSQLEQVRRTVKKYLLDPGADLVVCDEGHIIKNNRSAISLAVAQIATPRRIILTGTPIQNNLKEYYSMVNFIKPLFLGTEKEFANLYANPIRNGQHKDSSKNDIKIMKQRSFVLHKKLSKFVQRKEAELLKTFLPPKFEYVLFIPMTIVQNNLYKYILNSIENREDNQRGRSLVTDYTCLRKIWTHPKVLEDAWKNAQKNKKEVKSRNQSEDDQPDDIYDSQTGQMSVNNDWWRHLVDEHDLESIISSNKLRTMFSILQMCEEKGEKCLIFSAFVAVLNVVEFFFDKISKKNPQILRELHLTESTATQWIPGRDYYRLDGKTPKSIRYDMIKVFNSGINKRTRVFLISAKAGGQGINLTGANRVIILDTSWNPSSDQQNIFRVFRLGQKRNCYIYRLLAMGTMEEKVYSRSVTKQAMSFRVVDEQQIDRHYSMAELTELYTLTTPDYTNRPIPVLPQDSILARLLRGFPDLVFKYHEHDSLLENKMEQELSEQEKTEAWDAYERDLLASSEGREFPTPVEFHNNMMGAKLPNYISPFTSLDVSKTNNTSNNNVSNKKMASLLPYRSLGQSLTSSSDDRNMSAQQYLELYSFYKSLGVGYVDLNSYSASSLASAASNAAATLMNRYPMLGTGTGSGQTINPLTALGDLSMLNASMNSTNSISGTGAGGLVGMSKNPLANLLPPGTGMAGGPLPTLYNPATNLSSPSGLGPSGVGVAANGNGPGGGGIGSPDPSSILSAYNHYSKALGCTLSNMYAYGSDFNPTSSNAIIHEKSQNNYLQKISHLVPTPASALPLSSPSSVQLTRPGSIGPPPLPAGSGSNLPGGLANESTLSIYQAASLNILQQSPLPSSSSLTAPHHSLRSKNLFTGNMNAKDSPLSVDMMGYKVNDHRSQMSRQLTPNEMTTKAANYMDVVTPPPSLPSVILSSNKAHQQQTTDSNLKLLQSTGGGSNDEVSSSTLCLKNYAKRRKCDSPLTRIQSSLNNGVMAANLKAQMSAEQQHLMEVPSNFSNTNKGKQQRIVSTNFLPNSLTPPSTTVFTNEPQQSLTSTTQATKGPPTTKQSSFPLTPPAVSQHPFAFSSSSSSLCTAFPSTAKSTGTVTSTDATSNSISSSSPSQSPYPYTSSQSNTIRISPKTSLATSTTANINNSSFKYSMPPTNSQNINSLGMVRASSSKSVSNSPGGNGLGLIPKITTVASSANEMLIIPTTSPPGSASISKQYNDLSPSISLTAVKPNATGNNTNSQPKSAHLLVKPTTPTLGLSSVNPGVSLQSTSTFTKRSLTLSNSMGKSVNSGGGGVPVNDVMKSGICISSPSEANNLPKLKGVKRKALTTTASINLTPTLLATSPVSPNNNGNECIGNMTSTLPNNISKLITGNAMNRNNLTITTARIQTPTDNSVSSQSSNTNATSAGIPSPQVRYSNSVIATSTGACNRGRIFGQRNLPTGTIVTSSPNAPSLKRPLSTSSSIMAPISLAAIKKTLNIRKSSPVFDPNTCLTPNTQPTFRPINATESKSPVGTIGNIGSLSIRPTAATITAINCNKANKGGAAIPTTVKSNSNGSNMPSTISGLTSLPSSLSICKTVVQRPAKVTLGSAVGGVGLATSKPATTTILPTLKAGKIMNCYEKGGIRGAVVTTTPSLTARNGAAKNVPPLTLTSNASATITAQPQINIVRGRTTGSLNIRPLDSGGEGGMSGGASGDVYIIETNINDKKLAIGTPTKSGGGTTVTKVMTVPAKRKTPTENQNFIGNHQQFDMKRSKN